MKIFGIQCFRRCFFLFFIVICIVNDCGAARKSKISPKKTSHFIKEKQTEKIPTAKQEILMDFDTSEVLHSKDSEIKCFPSSMTKVMTAYMVFAALKDGRLRLDDELPVSENAQHQEGSRSFFRAGTLAKVEDLIRSVIVHSGNDACVVLAEKLSGDEDAFVKEMNEKATEFGLKNTHFTNSTGFPDEEHYSCLYDIAIIAKRIIQDFPEYYHYFSEKTFTVNDITQHNRNTLLGNSLNVDGLKTGKAVDPLKSGASPGGFGIVISAKKNGKRLIAVVNGCKSSKARTQEVNKILAMGFNEIIPIKISDKEKPIGTVSVVYGKRNKVNLYSKEDIIIPIPKKHKNTLVVELDVKEPIEAPVILGVKLGKMRYKYGNYVSRDYDLFASEPVARMNIFERCIFFIKELFAGNVANSKLNKSVETPIGIGIR